MFKNILKSLGFGFLIVVFPTIAGVIAQVKGIESESSVNLLTALMFLIASCIGYLIYTKFYKKLSFVNQETNSSSNLDFTSGDYKNKVLYFIPLVIMESLNLFVGFNKTLDIKAIGILLLLCIFVGIAEEYFFRGIIFKELGKSFSVKSAMIISTAIFSLLHLVRLIPNILGGAPIQTINYTLLQLVYAFLFGILAVYLTLYSKSLIPAIIWHLSHDFLTLITSNEINTKTLILLGIELVIMVAYILVLRKNSLKK